MSAPVRIVANWRAVLTRAWSMRLIYLVMLINGLEAALWLAGAALPGPAWARALASFAIAAAAAWARIVLQPKLKAPR